MAMRTMRRDSVNLVVPCSVVWLRSPPIMGSIMGSDHGVRVLDPIEGAKSLIRSNVVVAMRVSPSPPSAASGSRTLTP